MQWVRHLRFAVYLVTAAWWSLIFCTPCVTWSLTTRPIIDQVRERFAFYRFASSRFAKYPHQPHTAKKTAVLWACGESRQSLHLHPSRPYCRHKETWNTTKTLDGHQRLDRTISGWVRENCTGQNSMACKGVADLGLRPSRMRKNQSSRPAQ